MRNLLEGLALSLKEKSNAFAGTQVYVCSFSEEADSLAQWRAYCDRTSGYAIGLCSKYLGTRGAEEEFILARCIYEPNEQEELICQFIDYTLSNERALRELDSYLYSEIFQLAPILKDKSFEAEKEWRLISPTFGYRFNDIEYREGHSMIVPFVRLSLKMDDPAYKSESAPRPIREVVVAPTPNPEQSKISVYWLLLRSGLGGKDGPDVRSSCVPYRSW